MPNILIITPSQFTKASHLLARRLDHLSSLNIISNVRNHYVRHINVRHLRNNLHRYMLIRMFSVFVLAFINSINDALKCFSQFINDVGNNFSNSLPSIFEVLNRFSDFLLGVRFTVNFDSSIQNNHLNCSLLSISSTVFSINLS